MTTTLLRIGLRFLISNKFFKKGSISALYCGISEKQNILLNCNQFCKIAPLTYSTRSVHQTDISANELNNEINNDFDTKQERGQTLFWRRKMRTLHNHLDVDKDGVISYDDFILFEKRFSNLGHLTPEAKTKFKKILNEMWEEQWGEISPYNLICIEKYLEKMQHVLNDSALKRKCHHFLPFLFKAVDKDQSGEISQQEFRLFFQCLGLTHDDAIISFSHIDTNDDGKISFDEFITLGREFFLTEDPRKPSKYFWGPLVD